MKKLMFLLSSLLVTGGGALLAQDRGAPVPPLVQQCFHNDYPGTTAVVWRPLGKDWWNGAARANGQIESKSCNLNGAGAAVALPVKETYVPESVMSALTNRYGPALYDVTCVKGIAGTPRYVVKLLENGQLRIEQADI